MSLARKTTEHDDRREDTPRDVNLPARLSAQDSALLVAVAESQNPPNEHLKRAAEQYKQRYS